jgi:hypothetical protein
LSFAAATAPLKLTTTAHVVLFAVTRRDSGASLAGRPRARLASFAKRSRFLPESACEIQWVRHVTLIAGSRLRLMGFAFDQPIPYPSGLSALANSN